jgi:phenylalanyl-tRNA synthetase alpha chain
MREEISNIKNQAIGQIMEAKDATELERIRIEYLGRSGKINELTKRLKNLKSDERRHAGVAINEAKNTLSKMLAEQKNSLKESAREWFDPTIPGEKPAIGHLHLVTQTIEEISNIFEKIGFVRVRYPEVEWDWYAFGSLNMPLGHPARDVWETFFVNAKHHPKLGEIVLTPHTSSGQVREMERVGKPPIRMINIAKCYRRQSDVSHYPMFHQFEGLVIDRDINITHLKGTLDYFARQYYGEDIVTRIRPYNFKFTEPSFEVDFTCTLCRGKGCKLCRQGWLEMGGAGMIHPEVLKNGGLDPKKYTGFAFGWGVERVAMMKPGLNIPDLRLLYNANLDYLKQF